VPYLILRISNPYGPYQAAKNNGYGIINYFIQLALRGEPIRLFGDGSQIRDFVYVDDLMDILLCAIAAPACHNQIFNLGGRKSNFLEGDGRSDCSRRWRDASHFGALGRRTIKLSKLGTM
jgi:UDP-glucose 4-epimerase